MNSTQKELNAKIELNNRATSDLLHAKLCWLNLNRPKRKVRYSDPIFDKGRSLRNVIERCEEYGWEHFYRSYSDCLIDSIGSKLYNTI